jgi:hypothetical protein
VSPIDSAVNRSTRGTVALNQKPFAAMAKAWVFVWPLKPERDKASSMTSGSYMRADRSRRQEHPILSRVESRLGGLGTFDDEL